LLSDRNKAQALIASKGLHMTSTQLVLEAAISDICGIDVPPPAGTPGVKNAKNDLKREVVKKDVRGVAKCIGQVKALFPLKKKKAATAPPAMLVEGVFGNEILHGNKAWALIASYMWADEALP
jgi:hypothetical protein